MARELILGISGGIAAYKSAALASQLVQAGWGVTAVMTDSAHEFVGPATFAALTGRRVETNVFDQAGPPLGVHIELAERGDLLCIAPATANVLAKAATGLSDDLLSTLLLSFAGPIVFAPAMNGDMWAKPSVQRNVATLRDDGYHFVDPVEGWLSCRKQGVGRMAEPEAIRAAIEKLVGA